MKVLHFLQKQQQELHRQEMRQREMHQQQLKQQQMNQLVKIFTFMTNFLLIWIPQFRFIK